MNINISVYLYKYFRIPLRINTDLFRTRNELVYRKAESLRFTMVNLDYYEVTDVKSFIKN